MPMPRPDATLLRATGLALIAGPAVFLIDNLIHPEELGRGNEAEQLAAIAAVPDRWQLAHLIGFAALLIFAVAALGLAAIVADSDRRLALYAGAAAMAGVIGFAFAIALDGFTWGVLGEVSGRPGIDASTIETAFAEIQKSAWALPYYAIGLGWIGGMPALAWGAVRGGVLGARPAALLGLGAVAVGFEGVLADNAYFIASSALLLAGGTDAGRALLSAGSDRSR